MASSSSNERDPTEAGGGAENASILLHSARAVREQHLQEFSDSRHGYSVLLSAQTIAAIGGFVALIVLVFVLRRRRRGDVDEEKGHGGGTPSKRARGTLVSRLRRLVLFLPRSVASHVSTLIRKGARAATGGDSGTDAFAAPANATHERFDHAIEMSDVSALRTPDMERGLRERLGVPTLLASTSDPPTVLSNVALQQLRSVLPLRFTQSDWTLLYSTEQHGCSLRTFYSRLDGHSGTLLAVLDAEGHVFGSFVAEEWRHEGRYFGNGETFVYALQPAFRIYNWTRANTHFVLAAKDCVAWGGGGAFALWLDSSFEAGSSNASDTYGNDCLAGSTNFKCVKVEVWGLLG
jgi:hypothetical protein